MVKSCMSVILISRYIQLWHAIPLVSHCFQLDKIVHIFRNISLILMWFSAKDSSLIALPKQEAFHLIISCIHVLY